MHWSGDKGQGGWAGTKYSGRVMGIEGSRSGVTLGRGGEAVPMRFAEELGCPIS